MENQNNQSILSLPILKQVDLFRNSQNNKCLAKKEELSGKIKEKEQIVADAKKDVAYQATQNMLPEELRLDQNQVVSTGLGDARNFFDFHLNNACSKFFGSKEFFYIAFVVLVLLILKAFSKK